MSGSAITAQIPTDKFELAGTVDNEKEKARSVDLDASALIRQIVVEQRGEADVPNQPEPDAARVESKATNIRHPRRTYEQHLVIKAEKKRAQPAQKAKPSPGNFARLPRRLLVGIKSYRPTRKHIFFAVIAVIMLLRPLLIPITLIVTFFVVLISYFTLGPDRVAEMVVNNWQRLNRYRPDLAENLRQRAEVMARRVDSFLDKMPGSWSEQIHVPDFSPDQGIAFEGPDPFERLAKEAHQV